ncbi:hypothetical protein [Polymorphobacter megasporae]|uniref:hypothetical protein n=1 Tax=Glacieibacterium megasporae TaxID=2835787 RepID=UPI001C1E29E5|nr:hypothetical protein [Polymorphobacter megasporae]UAJ11223.1 hypothetical protein KTC28_05820 [Polymorphobacter megasporae]
MKRAAALLATAALAVTVAGVARASDAGGLTKVAGFDHQVTGVSVTPDGRTFVNFPRWTVVSHFEIASRFL